MDAATIRLLGRHRIADDLIRAGLHAAVPLADGSGIDLFAFAIPGSAGETFVAIPVRVRASSGRSFGFDEDAERIPNLLHAFVWGIGSQEERVYAMSHREARGVAEKLGFTLATSGQFALYEQHSPQRPLLEVMEPYRMTPEAWKQRLR